MTTGSYPFQISIIAHASRPRNHEGGYQTENVILSNLILLTCETIADFLRSNCAGRQPGYGIPGIGY
jgi:hypothetical protein